MTLPQRILQIKDLYICKMIAIKGIVLQLQDESANIYSVNDKLTVWLPGSRC